MTKKEVDKVILWQERDFWLLPSNCDPHTFAALTRGRASVPLPSHFVKIDAKAEIKLSADKLNETLVKWSRVPIYETSLKASKTVGDWATVTSCAMMRARSGFSVHLGRTLGREIHYYFEHPHAVDVNAIRIGLDWLRDRDEWNDKPGGELVVPHLDSFAPPGLRLAAVGALVALPNWTVRAPVSLRQKAKRAPVVSANVHGHGTKSVFQQAYRKSDIARLWGEWLGLPWEIYFRQLHSRYVPKGYYVETYKQSSTHD